MTMDFFSGDMTGSDCLANRDAIFRPAVNAADNGGSYAVPGIEIGGVLVTAYVRDGILVVSLDFDGAEAGPFAVYDGGCIPVIVKAGNSEPVWTALPGDAITEGDARQLRRTGDSRPGDWVLPDWVYG